MDRDYILSLVNEIYFGPQTNKAITPLLDKLDRILPHSNISDLIFQDMRNLRPEQVVDEAMRQEANYIAGRDGKLDKQ